MKKTLIIVGIVLVLLVASLLVLPLVFKQTLMDKTKTTINQNINGEVEFTDFKLSLIKQFPKLTVELREITLIGKGQFQQDTLLKAKAVSAHTGMFQLFNTENMQIDEISLEAPELKLVVAESGDANWNIVAEPADETPQDETESGLNLQLEKIEISEADFVYDDRQTEMIVGLENINFIVSGKMYGTSAELDTDGGAERFSLLYKGNKYISNLSVETQTKLNIDYEKMDISISKNELLLNRLPLEINGMIQIPNDSMLFNLNLKTSESGFDNFLALVPPGYEKYLEDIETSGSATIAGEVTGFYIGENYPAFNIDMKVVNGNIHYADLPEEIKNISAAISIRKPQGELDLTEVKVENARAEVKNNPLNFNLLMKNLVSDPYFDGELAGKLNFNDLKAALPMDSVYLEGLVDANVKVKGKYSAIENEIYNQIESDGTVVLTDFVYDSPKLTRQVLVTGGRLEFSPRDVKLTEFDVNIGQSDFNLQGSVSNYLGYYFSDATLSGNLRLNSSLVNLNELLRLQVNEEQPEENVQEDESTEESLAFDIPGNIDFTFRSNIQRVIFDQLPITNVNGLITAQNGKLVLDGLTMQMLDGTLALNGSYQNTPQNQPLFDFGLDADGFAIPEAYKTLTGFRKIVPVAGQSEGEINTDLRVSGRLSPAFKLIGPTIDGNGTFGTENLRIVNSPVFNQLKGILKAEKLNNVSVDDFSASIVIEDGGVNIKPFSTKIAGQETTVSGSINTQNLIDMRLDFNVERDAFGPDIQSILSVLPGEERIKQIPASVLVQGPVGEAKVKVNLDEARKKITEEVKKSTKEDLQKSLDKLGKGLKDLFK
jgi:uncharacterized protein involved in outer membrane biogenesis